MGKSGEHYRNIYLHNAIVMFKVGNSCIIQSFKYSKVTSSMFKIYGIATFNPIKVLLTAEELGADYEFITLDVNKGEHKSPEYLKRHPLGKFPVLEHEGEFFIESASLCRYLANCHDKKMYSADPKQAARIDQTMDLVAHHIGRWFGAHYWNEVVLAKWMKKEPNQAELIEAKGWLEKHLPAIDQMLDGKEFLCGDEITIADTFALAYFQTTEATSASFDDQANIVRWYKAMSARESVAKVKKLFAK